MSAIRERLIAVLGCAGVLGACELDDVTIPGGDDVLVIEAVLRAGEPVQRVLLHRTLDGPVVKGEPGADVIVVSASGDTLVFEDRPFAACVASDSLPGDAEASCYIAEDVPAGWIEPGDEYELHVRTVRGEHAFGRTTVPADFAMVGLPPAASGGKRYRCTLPPQQSAVLRWTVSPTATAYLSELTASGLRDALADTGIPDIPEPLRLTGVSVSATDTTIRLPSAYGVEERWNLDQDLLRAVKDGFPEGVRVAVLVGAGDKNMADSYRERVGLTGTVRGPSVTGDGTGLFGSIVPLWLDIEVTDGAAGDSCLGG